MNNPNDQLDWIPDSELIISKINESEDETNTRKDITWLRKMMDWLKQDDEISDAHPITLLQDLSLDLPSYLLKLYFSTLKGRSKKLDDRSNEESPSSDEEDRLAIEYCLNRLAEDGNPKEVFLSLTAIIPQLFNATTNSDLRNSQSPSNQNSSSKYQSGSVQDLFCLFHILLPPLSIVANKILIKSRNPNIFLNQFSQTILCIMESLRRGGEQTRNCDKIIKFEELTEIYRRIIGACWTCRSKEDGSIGRISVILGAVTGVLFGDWTVEWPLAKAYLCHHEPKWRPSFSRLMSQESSSITSSRNIIFNDDKRDPVVCLQEAIAPIIDAFANCSELKEHIIHLAAQLCDKSHTDQFNLDGLGYGGLTDEALVRPIEEGSLLISAFDAFLRIGTHKDQSLQPTNDHSEKNLVMMQTVNRILSSSPSFLEIYLFLILSHPHEIALSPHDEHQKLCLHLLHLAANDPLESNRLIIFRSFAYFINNNQNLRKDQNYQIEFLIHLIKSNHHLIYDQLNIKISLIYLLREALSRSHLFQDEHLIVNSKNKENNIKLIKDLILELIDPTMLELAQINHHHLTNNNSNGDSSAAPAIADLLKFNTEKLNLVFLLSKLDHQNLVGIQHLGTLNKIVKQKLIDPIHLWININSTDINNNNNQLAFFSIKLALDLCIQSIN